MAHTLADTYPTIASWWDSDKNGKNFTPDDVTPRSGKKVWWICPKGHSWGTMVSNMTAKKDDVPKCPVCHGRKVIPGVNDVLTTHPHLKEFINPDTPQEHDLSLTSFGSSKKINWECPKGHTWTQSVHKMITSKSNGCPQCAGNASKIEDNNLAKLYPEIAKEWSSKNPITPDKVKPKTNKKYIWECAEGHEWETTPNSRVTGNYGCPYCSNYKPITGINDFATAYPEIATEWDYDKNGDLDPTMLMKGTSREVWWKCKTCDHSWKTSMYHRAKRKSGCPACSGRVTTPGVNDISTTHPHMVEFYHHHVPPLFPHWSILTRR